VNSKVRCVCLLCRFWQLCGETCVSRDCFFAVLSFPRSCASMSAVHMSAQCAWQGGAVQTGCRLHTAVVWEDAPHRQILPSREAIPWHAFKHPQRHARTSHLSMYTVQSGASHIQLRSRTWQLWHAGELDASATVLRFYYIDSPPPLSVGLFFIHNHADGSYSGDANSGQKICLPCKMLM
jgi:hypothetical protein